MASRLESGFWLRWSRPRTARRRVIDEVVHGDPHPRYRVRWDDGRESIYTPADGALKPDRTTTDGTWTALHGRPRLCEAAASC